MDDIPRLLSHDESFSSFSSEESYQARQSTFSKKGGYGSVHDTAVDMSSGQFATGMSASAEVLRSFRDATTQAATLSWEDLWATIPAKKSLFSKKSEPIEILKGISGVVKPGTLMAIMGASGSGKTTLLNVLTGRNIRHLEIEGAVKVNGAVLGKGIANLSAYVQQHDMFVGILTVRQHMWFQAMLRMDSDTTIQQRKKRVHSVLRKLGLLKCADSVIGQPNKVKSLSGGERKRLAFASEILTNPSIMFCDEPTSGLDSFMAESVVNTLKSLANDGKTIVTTIHQPSSEIFALFDNLLLLANGRLIFMGSSSDAREFFAKCGYLCPTQYNPADFYIRTLAVIPGQEDESRQRIQTIGSKFTASEQGTELVEEVRQASVLKDKDIVAHGTLLDFSTQSRFKASYLTQLQYVGWRSFMSSNLNPQLVGIRLVQNFAIALLSGIIYLNQPNNQKGVQNVNGAIFLMATNLTFGNMFTVITTYTAELPLFKRDNENGTYRTSVYFLCKALAETPVFTLNPIIFTALIYWMVGLKPDAFAYLICTVTSVLLTNIVVAFGSMVSCIAGEANIALALSGPLLVPFSLFGGFLLNDDSIPVYLIWLEYLSWFKYSNEIYFINQWHNFGPIGCEFDNTTIPAGNSSTGGGGQCFADGEAVLEGYSYSVADLELDFVCLAALLVGFSFLAYVALYIRANPFTKRRSKHFLKPKPVQH